MHKLLLFFFLAKPILTIDNTKRFEKMFIRVGENATLSCPFKDFDSFEWHKNQQQFVQHQVHRTITFENITLQDEGN